MSVREHYDNFLARYYSWMSGDYEAKVQENIDFFRKHQILPDLNRQAIDLGCGSGFQSIALAELGFEVLSVDLSTMLLEELNIHRGSRKITTVLADMLDFDAHCGEIEVITCMGDTLTHLPSLDQVIDLFRKAYIQLQPGGSFCLTFRDMSMELKGLDRIIPVQSDENTIMTCFLEYKDERVRVNDIIYYKTLSGWELTKSSYYKLRISAEWIIKHLAKLGFKIKLDDCHMGFAYIIAVK